MELIELQCMDFLHEKLRNVINVLSFFVNDLTNEKYHLLARHGKKLISLFGSSFSEKPTITGLTDVDFLTTTHSSNILKYFVFWFGPTQHGNLLNWPVVRKVCPPLI